MKYKKQKRVDNFSLYYIHKFFASNSSADLLANNLFPNAKELTESWGALEAVDKHIIPLGISRNSEYVDVFAIGDGYRPRTAALFSFHTKWNSYSIDPLLVIKNYTIKRLTLIKEKIEKLPDFYSTDRVAIIVLVHSHADIKICWEKIDYQNKFLVTIPCCYKKELTGVNLITEYNDESILSKENKVRIYGSTEVLL